MRHIKLFLASPGDVLPERQLVIDAVDEINKEVAPRTNSFVEVKGWEDTHSGPGRPQDLINKEADKCELFVGIMWKKWGTPPANEGPYTSGFEEEFELALERYKETGEPNISMYFKSIEDPIKIKDGEDFAKVQADIEKVRGLQSRLENEKPLLYNPFETATEFQRKVRLKITNYLFDLEKAEQESEEQEQARTKQPLDESESTEKDDSKKSPFSEVGHKFLTKFIKDTKAEDSEDNITPFEVARFRLLSCAVSKSGNDKTFLGVHDANIIFKNRKTKLGLREISNLVNTSLKHIDYENAPLWFWYKAHSDEIQEDILPLKSFYNSDEDVSIGALKAMDIVGTALPNKPPIDRQFILERWFSDKSSDEVKVAALRYLKNHGVENDLSFIQTELESLNSKTSRMSIEAYFCIQYRYNKLNAAKYLFQNQFEMIDEELLNNALYFIDELDEDLLRLGLKHSNSKIRLESFKKLIGKQKIVSDDIQSLANDKSAEIRFELVNHFLNENQPLNDDVVKRTLVKPVKGMGIFGSGYDREGRAMQDKYNVNKHMKMSEQELLEKIQNGLIFNDDPYFVLCDRYFKKYADKLRENVDNKFKEEFEKYIKRLEETGLEEDSVKQSRKLEEHIRTEMTRRGLDVLCKHVEEQDLNRVRNGLSEDFVDSSICEIQYLQKVGGWEDISIIANANKTYSNDNSLLVNIGDGWDEVKAEAIYSIGRERLDEVFNIKMPSGVLVELIKISSSPMFSKVSEKTLLGLLESEEDKLRKAVSLKISQTFKKADIKTFLSKYLDSDDYHYYNVIYWLDFGASLTKSVVNNGAKRVFSML